MTVTAKVFVPAKDMATTDTKQYTADNVTAIVDKCTVTNTSATTQTFSINIIASGGSASSANLIIKSRSLQPNQTYVCPEIVGHTLTSGDSINTIASATGLTLKIGGREIT